MSKTAYKLLHARKNNTLGPLFINRRQVIPFGTWLQAEDHPTANFAHRPGWHCCDKPSAPHLSMKDRIWCVVEIEDYTEFVRPAAQGGLWYLAQRMKVLEPVVVTAVPDSPNLIIHHPAGVAVMNMDAVVRVTVDEPTGPASGISRRYPYNSQQQ
jgi:hypothetical protein